MTPELQKILDRIQKLLAIAKDDRANPEEAASAAGMAERMMRKYQIDHQDLIVSAMKQSDGMTTGEVVVSAKTNGTPVKEVPLWANWISLAVSRLNDCGSALCFAPDGQKAVRFYGFSTDVQVTCWMYQYLTAAVMRLCEEFKKTPQYAAYGRTALNSYRSGVAIGIVRNLEKALADKKAEATVASAGTSLMVVKQQLVEQKWPSVFKVGHAKTKTARGDAYSKGLQDGKAVRLASGALGGAAPAAGRLA